MKKLFCMVIVAMVTSLLGGCFETGSPAGPPTLIPTQGDNRVMLSWTASPSVDYWIFTATDPGLTAFNWTGLPNAHAYVSATTPYYVCGLINGKQTYFAANGRINGGPGGPSSSTVSATPYDASAKAWATGTTPTTTADLLGVGYAGLTTCGNNSALSATGMFAAVGTGGAIFTSNDGNAWTNRSPPGGFTTNLNAVTGYAVNQNTPTNPALRWVAVGNGGTSIYSLDGISWAVGRTYNVSNPALRSITHVAGTFFAVGDAGTILSSTDGITWTSYPTLPTGVTAINLNGITYGGYDGYVAVGDSGTILTGNPNSWTLQTVTPGIPAGINLHGVTSFVSAYGTIYVAVGDKGTIVTSSSIYPAWTTQTIAVGSPTLVGVTVESRGVETNTAYTTAPPVDPKLGFISSAQFVAVDSSGQTYTSPNGYDWTASGSTGASCATGTTCMNPLLSTGFGYVTVGNSGVVATSF